MCIRISKYMFGCFPDIQTNGQKIRDNIFCLKVSFSWKDDLFKWTNDDTRFTIGHADGQTERCATRTGLFSDTVIGESVWDEPDTDLIASPVHSNPEKRVTSG